MQPPVGSKTSRRSDAELARLPVDEALPLLLEQHGNRLYGMALKLCGHPDDAQDLVQEIFLIALRKWHQYHGDARPTTWLYTIAARACMRKRRRRAGEPEHMESLTDLLPDPEDQIADLDVLNDPLDEHLRNEVQESVENAIAQLPMNYRMPLVLKEIVELPIADIASVLGIKAATVKTRIHRGRLLLRRELSRCLPQQDAPPPDHSRQMCLDLLKAKQESLDRGVPFRVAPEELCTRCEALFSTLDLAHEICDSVGHGEMPEELRAVLDRAFAEAGNTSVS